MQKLIRVEPSKCIGCKTCELACSFKHFDEFAPSKSRIVNEVFLDEAAFVTVTCMQCDEPWCLKACPAGAISKNSDTGVVLVDENQCVGCRTCVSACPFGMIKYAESKMKADKCDLCGGDYPECVAFCPTGCLTFEEEDTPTRSKIKKFATSEKKGTRRCNMTGGWAGKILRIDLSKESYSVEDLNLDTAKKFIGGRGLAVKYFTDEVPADVDAYSDKNKVFLAVGPLTGTYGAANGRYMVVTKSPQSGTIASSNSGGYFPSELKYAGYDMVVLEGKAKNPVYVTIYNDNVEIRSAKKLWGKTTHETEDIIHEKFHQDAKIASIGPAGEKLVKFSCIMNDKHRAAGRSGVGAVMGSKNVKAIAVRGTGGVKISDKTAYRNAAFGAYKLLKDSPVTSQGLPAYGTAVLVNVINETGLFPTNNFQGDTFAKAEDISGETMADTILKRNKACMGCIIGCGRVTAISDPRFSGEGEGPEYEPIWALGADCGISDLKAIARANYICNEYGFDPITAGGTIACAMEMYENGIISKEEIGRSLEFGDADAMVEMMEKIANREGFGDKLAEGSYRLAEEYGKPDYSMSVKKLEFPAYDGRVAQGMAINYATSNRGACHVRGYMISPEILGVPEKMEPTSIEGKAEWTKAFQDTTALVDSSGICLFTTFAITPEEVKNFFNAATGLNYSADDLVEAGERIWNLERLYNLDAGIDPSQDTLPKRILEEPVPDGPQKGSMARLSETLPKYYEARGWLDGIPTSEKLAELGLR